MDVGWILMHFGWSLLVFGTIVMKFLECDWIVGPRRFSPAICIYIYMVTPPPRPAKVHFYWYLQYEMQIFGVPILSFSYVFMNVDQKN